MLLADRIRLRLDGHSEASERLYGLPKCVRNRGSPDGPPSLQAEWVGC